MYRQNKSGTTICFQSVHAIKWDKERLNKIIHTLSQSGTFVPDDIVMRFHENRQELSFNAYIIRQIARLKRLGKIRTSETYAAALRSFSVLCPNNHYFA